MAEISTVARPYAQAAFEMAKESGDYKSWSEGLAFAASLVQDDSMVELINNPRIERSRLAELFDDLCADRMTQDGRNLVRLMVSNNRLLALPSAAQQYEAMRSEAEGTIEAEITAAQAISDAQQANISKALEKKLGRKVSLTVHEDPALLGGAIIRAGDLVIDGSAKGRLEKLASALVR